MKADAVICGAGIVGVATAYQLVKNFGLRRVVIVDPLPPLSLTSDKSTECYRNWWPNAPMVGLMNRSIDLLEEFAAETNNAFHMTRQGYLYVTADPIRLSQMEAEAQIITSLGGGPFELFDTGGELLARFPFLTEASVGGLHARRAGWFSAHQLGAYLLDQARDHGAELLKGKVLGVESIGGRVGVVETDVGKIEAPIFVDAAGPMLNEVAQMLDTPLPVHSEVHIKVAFRDHAAVIPRSSPMMIWSDPQSLDWTAEERAWLAEQDRGDLLGVMPAACHYRPEGGVGSQWVVGLWEYHRIVQEPSWPLPEDPLYPEAVIRGLSTAVPGLSVYRDHLPQPVVDGGYYTKTAENRPLIGRLPIEGAFVVGAFSGFGVMAAAGAGELAAQIITGKPLPDYASAFSLDRYQDPTYLNEISMLTTTGQI
ncbi:MAG TPA: FAD-binding oxidoreductase [Acidimicrobiia bacterium]|nr:FAD-binding oxidoreductase [Acidimicrobiia bacterium]